ncbi:MAG: SET domain-containing protein [Ilumatobacteraceae bacterium]
MTTFQVADSALHGRGLVAATDIAAGTTIAVWPLLVFDTADPVWGTGSLIEHYVFELDDGFALILGEGSLLNHRRGDPNCAIELGDETATVTSLRDIRVGDELTIDYAAGDPDRDFGF